MTRQELLLSMRKSHTLKGLKPAFVTLRMNAGKIYSGPFGNFILSLRDNILYFQKISTFLRRLQKKYDFEINAKRFNRFQIINKNYFKVLYLYDSEGCYLEITYMYGNREFASTEENIYRITEELKKTIDLKEVDFNEGFEEE